MNYSIEEVGPVVGTAGCAARIAGRCSVFAKSDMIHAQQKGYAPPEILRGLCDAVARNFKSSIVKGRKVMAPVALIGAVSQNDGVTAALRRGLRAEGRRADRAGAVRLVRRGGRGDARVRRAAQAHVPRHPPPAPARSRRRRGHRRRRRFRWRTWSCCATAVTPYTPPAGNEPIPAYLGIDIGSVSTNVVAMDECGTVIHDVYLRTAGRPIEAVQQGLAEVRAAWGHAPGDPGRGHHRLGPRTDRGARGRRRGQRRDHRAQDRRDPHVSTLGGEPVDTIFEIGGQDSKFISIENGVVVDFAMNEACAAGTGSFLEEQAEKLGISIKGEFARLALSTARRPRGWASAARCSWSATSRAGCTRARPCRTWWRAWPTRSR